MSHRKQKETKQQPGTARPGNILGYCLVSLRFLCNIHSIHSLLFVRKCATFLDPPPLLCGRHIRKPPYLSSELPYCKRMNDIKDMFVISGGRGGALIRSFGGKIAYLV